MPQELALPNFDAVLAKVDRLQRSGYTAKGRWNLGQICDHLSFFIEGTLDGHSYKAPWLLKVLVGRMVLKRILSQKKMKAGVLTPQKPLPDPSIDQAASIARFKHAVKRLNEHTGAMHDSPFFGHLTPEQWRELHLIHANHHLAYLESTEVA